MLKITRKQFFEFIKTTTDELDDHRPEALTYSTKHYLKYYDQYQTDRKKSGWNWAAFCSVWFFYRRMYTWGILVFLSGLLFDYVVEKMLNMLGAAGELRKVIDLSTLVVFAIICMRYADYLYLSHVSDEVIAGKKFSGVSVWAAIMAAILVLFFGY